MRIVFPFGRVFGLLGAPRIGKGLVANFLTETRGFVQFAFADQIKEEFGISKKDFESAKITGQIEKIRQQLWEFSAKKKRDDPNYFIRKVFEKIKDTESSIITDIRTEEELKAFYTFDFGVNQKIRRLYWIRGRRENEIDEHDCLAGSMIDINTILNECEDTSAKPTVYMINNNDQAGIYTFYNKLNKYFIQEDLFDLWNDQSFKYYYKTYIKQFEIIAKEKL